MTGHLSILPDVGWMLRPLIEIPGVRHAVVVSEDGLRLGHASAQRLTGPVGELSTAQAESLSAACAAMNMTGRSTTSLLFGAGAGMRQLMLESEHGFVLFSQAGAGAHLAVATGTDADIGLVAQQMQLLVARIGAHLSSRPRDPVADPS